ncbi:MAG TPA: sulfotransferase [Rhodanobacteraceae bacterium]|nr:sulfotransferase [Rhodanobacteraceae bacterium]
MSTHLALDLIHGANAAWRPLDAKLFAPPPKRDWAPLFVLGAPRSGSTLLFQVLAHSLRVTYLPRLFNYAYGAAHLVMRLFAPALKRHRPVFVSRLGATPGLLSPTEGFAFWRRWFWKGHDADHYYPALLSPAAAAELRDTVRAIEAHRDAPLLVKCPYLALAVPPLADALPTSRFVFIARDPIDDAVSILRGRESGVRGDWWSVRPPDYLAHRDEPETEQIMWQIAETTNLLRAQLEALPHDRWRLVRYEDLCARPREVVAELLAWLAPLGFEAWPDNALPEQFAASPKSDAELRQRFAASPSYPRAASAVR